LKRQKEEYRRFDPATLSRERGKVLQRLDERGRRPPWRWGNVVKVRVKAGKTKVTEGGRKRKDTLGEEESAKRKRGRCYHSSARERKNMYLLGGRK